MSVTQGDPLNVLLTVPQNPFGPKLSDEMLDQLDGTGFWQADVTLVRVAEVAHANEVSRWGLLTALIGHRLSHVPPNVVLVGRQGTVGSSVLDGSSLNFFGGLVGRTGAGKSEIMKLSNGLIPPRNVPLPTGTGQGFVKYLAETVKETKDAQGNDLPKPRFHTRMLEHCLVVHAAEITQLTGEMVRLGSQTSSMMRNIYVGETVGTLTGEVDRRVAMRPNSFRAVMLYGSQFDTAGRILGEYREGTPQRFAWAPVLEYRALSAPPSAGAHTFIRPAICDAASSGTQFAGQVSVSTDAVPFDWDLLPDLASEPLPPAVWVQWSPQMWRDIPALKAAMRAMDSNPFNDDHDPLTDAARLRLEVQSHGLLARIKAASGIAFLCGRSHISDLDWQLSDVYASIGLATAAGMWDECKAVACSQAESAGVTDAIRKGAQNKYVTGESDEIARRLTDAVRVIVERRVARHGPTFTARDIQTGQTGQGRYKMSEIREGLANLVHYKVVAHNKSTAGKYVWLG